MLPFPDVEKDSIFYCVFRKEVSSGPYKWVTAGHKMALLHGVLCEKALQCDDIKRMGAWCAPLRNYNKTPPPVQ